MLLNLHVKNLAIIDEVDIDFTSGLNIITGETGAGKSIIIGSINLALGAKVSKDIIRDGAPFALVELVFSYSDYSVKKLLEDAAIECEGNEIIISRKITSNRSVSKVNGETVTLSFVHQLAELLIDIHGQHDNKMLINSTEHINILDDFICDEANELFIGISDTYKEYMRLKKEYSSLDMDNDSRLREISLLEYEINEIKSAALKPDEDKILDEEYKLMSNMENITAIMGNALSLTENECIDSVSRSIRELNRISGISQDVDSMIKVLSEAESLLNDFIREVHNYIDENEFDFNEFEVLEKRVDLINGMKAKYGDSIAKILNYAIENEQRLEELQNHDIRLKDILDNLNLTTERLNVLCSELSKIRKDKAKLICASIVESLKDLNFNDADFSMEFTKKDSFTSRGFDEVNFLIKSNTGEGFKPLSKVASGGELSRVMLAIKSVIAGTQNMEAFIFDEIDAGISGRTAQAVAEKLTELAHNRQIICITHLAQIAAMADSHYVIEKNVENDRTFTNIRLLEKEEQTFELSRIIGGAQITDTVISSAKEMKKLADEFKNRL